MRIINVHFIFHFCLLRFCLVDGKWKNGLYFYNKSPPNTFSLPVQYVPVPTTTNQENPASYRQYDPFTNIPFPYDPYYQNYPGEAEVRSLQFSYPGQPVIVINNCGNGNSGRYFDDWRESEFEIEEFLKLMFAIRGGLGHGGHHHHHRPEIEIPREEPDLPRYPPPYSYYRYSGFGIGGDIPENMKPRESYKPSKINITIVLPSTSSSTNVQVENKTKEEKKKLGKNDEADIENE